MSWTRNTLWRQGSILAHKDFQTVVPTAPADADVAVAISHDCDIANDNLETEPCIEFIFASCQEQLNGNCTYGKNPRTLHLEYKREGEVTFLELLATRKITALKTSLINVEPDPNYELVTSHQILQSWLAARYRRHALPNSLVERLRPVFNFLDKEGKKNTSSILSLRLSYDPKDELPPEEIYELWLSIIYTVDKGDYQLIAEKMANNLENQFPSLLEKTKEQGKVELRQCRAYSETEFTLRDMRDTVEYHQEYLSYRSEPAGPTIT
jgi:hypothetical protein